MASVVSFICQRILLYVDLYFFENPPAGPGIVNLGRALSNGSNLYHTAIWLGTVILGGLIV